MESKNSKDKPSKRNFEQIQDKEQNTANKAQKLARTSTPNNQIVAKHYNDKPEIGVERRNESKILFLRNFNNWIKSVLIGKYAMPKEHVLEMGCGKGGDLLKWNKARIASLVGIDIAEVSIDDARRRWETMRGNKLHAEFYVLDCFSNPILSIKSIKYVKFDIVSMQFCLHYSFETQEKANMALRNVSSNLKKGGIFIGTVPDANWIVKKLKALEPNELKFGNSIYSVEFEQKHEFATFGHKYKFNLQDAINDCPEYLVYFPTLQSIAKEYGLELIYKKRFHDIYNEEKEERQYRDLLYRMCVIRRDKDEGEMSTAEWEAAGIYIGFAFEKVR